MNGETRVDEAMMDVGKETRQNCRRHGVGFVNWYGFTEVVKSREMVFLVCG